MSNNLSEDEISQLLKELDEYHKETEKQLDLNKVDYIQDHYEIESCLNHSWEEYRGLKEAFIHCKVCGEKQ